MRHKQHIKDFQCHAAYKCSLTSNYRQVILESEWYDMGNCNMVQCSVVIMVFTSYTLTQIYSRALLARDHDRTALPCATTKYMNYMVKFFSLPGETIENHNFRKQFYQKRPVHPTSVLQASNHNLAERQVRQLTILRTKKSFLIIPFFCPNFDFYKR